MSAADRRGVAQAPAPNGAAPREARQEAYYLASQWRLIWRKFSRHRLALVGMIVLALLYLAAAFGAFVSPYDPGAFSDHPFTPPQRVRFVDADGRLHLRPFVYLLDQSLNMRTLAREYAENRAEKRFVRFFTRGYEYKLFGLLPTDIHLFGVDAPGTLHLFGTDNLGRDLFSRNVYGAGISLTIGLVGVMLSFVLGCLLGGVSGYFGGTSDTVIQRIIEFLLSIPQIPLWMALSAALPTHWSPIKIYFGITIVLSIVGWTGLARIVRGRVLALRGADFALAAKICGAGEGQIIYRHLLPSVISYLIVHLTLAIPGHDPGRDGAELARPWHAAAGDQLGHAAEGRPAHPLPRPVPVAADSRAVRHRGRAGVQLSRRRAAGRRRSLQVA